MASEIPPPASMPPTDPEMPAVPPPPGPPRRGTSATSGCIQVAAGVLASIFLTPLLGFLAGAAVLPATEVAKIWLLAAAVSVGLDVVGAVVAFVVGWRLLALGLVALPLTVGIAFGGCLAVVSAL